MPDGKWYCERCENLYGRGMRPSEICCKFCPELKGIMTRTDRLGWAHVTCVNWMPELWYININDARTGKMIRNANVEGQPNNQRKNLPCKICKKKSGYVLQCDYQDCFHQFHVRCAMRDGII